VSLVRGILAAMRGKVIRPQRLLAALVFSAAPFVAAAALAKPEEPLADLVVTNVDGPDPVLVGRPLTYTVTVTNRGPAPASAVRLVDSVPSSLVVDRVVPSQGTCVASTLACELGGVAPGAVVTVQIRVRPSETGRVEATATATGAETDVSPADNSATTLTTVVSLTRPPPGPKVTGAVCADFDVTPLFFVAGSQVTAKVTVRAGGKPVAGARVVVRGIGVHGVARSNRRGVARLRVSGTRPGFLTISLPGRKTCRGARRIGVAGPFLPPVTG
jgi:uncharacterized repeat protein (TIGR01451 family)